MEKLLFEYDKNNRAQICDKISDTIADFCKKHHRSRRDVQRYRLAAEEFVLHWADGAKDGDVLTLTLNDRFLARDYFELDYFGPRYAAHPESDVNLQSDFTYRLLSSMGLFPELLYENGCNRIRFNLVSVEHSSLKTLLYSVSSAVVVGLLGMFLLPGSSLGYISDNIISPFKEIFTNLLCCVAGPMIFLSMVCGIHGIGDSATLSRIGKKTILMMLFINLVSGIFSSLFFIGKLTPSVSASSGASQSGSFVSMLVSFFPDNFIEPFSSGNTIQLLLFGFAFGIALLVLDKKVDRITEITYQANDLIGYFTEVVGTLLPVFVFCVILELFWSGTRDLLFASGKLLAMIFAGGIAFLLLLMLYTSIRLKIPFKTYFSKLSPAILIGVTTGSETASFRSVIEIGKKKLGIHPALVDFGVPLGYVVVAPITIITYIAVVIFYMNYYNMPCSFGTMISIIVFSSIIAIATPPVPGGATVAYSILLARYGIPSEALSVIITLDLFTDFLGAPSSAISILSSLSLTAKKVNMINTQILCSSDGTPRQKS